MSRQAAVWVTASGFSVGLLLLGPMVAGSQEQGGEELKALVAKWQDRRSQVRSVRYVVKGKGMVAKGAFSGQLLLPPADPKRPVPGKDHHFDIHLNWLIDFENNRMRKEFSGQSYHADAEQVIPNRYTHVYDGSGTKRLAAREDNTSASYAPPGRHPDLGIIENGNTVATELTDFPVFFAHGVIPTSRHPIDGAEKLRRPLDPRDYYLLNRAALGGKACLILRTVPPSGRDGDYEECWVEAGTGLVRREDLFYGRELICTFRDFVMRVPCAVVRQLASPAGGEQA